MAPQVPLKVSILAWRLLRDRLPTKANLVTRDILSSEVHYGVSGCGGVESAQHLFLSCSTFGSLWCTQGASLLYAAHLTCQCVGCVARTELYIVQRLSDLITAYVGQDQSKFIIGAHPCGAPARLSLFEFNLTTPDPSSLGSNQGRLIYQTARTNPGLFLFVYTQMGLKGWALLFHCYQHPLFISF
ncbi:hypothetical protein TSUD_102170 [Trifolium subterraneum]|uniref:Reverse transcriptase zinc-binding domain-containing protein n=1 Tax=Trifolium subterraneum TaxID=3900 RepID=A0A2Z6MSG1_TRISU|nr:hypothetical protein TSUD_102170 [Trifolium subterraneum]